MDPRPFDNRDGTIWFDGEMLSWRDAKVHVLTHGLHYGSAVFEGERAYGGRVFKLTEHSQRLVQSAAILGFDLPYSVEELDKATQEVVRANSIVDGYVRPIAWRGSEQMSIGAPNGRIHVAIATWEWPLVFDPERLSRGIRLCIAKWARPDPKTAPTASKAAGLYMICTNAKHEALKQGYDDALMFDYRGYIAEATGANIFLVIDGALHTPIADCFLDGITRRTIIDLAKHLGMNVVERHISPDELSLASEVFLTGTAVELTPVGEIAGHIYKPGHITEALMEAYHRATRG